MNDLLADDRMAEALSIFAASKAGEFKDIVAGLDPIARDAMQRKIIDEMKGGPDRVVKLLRRIIDYTPDTGGGIAGRAEDDRAVEYYQLARKQGALGTVPETSAPVSQR